MPQQIDEPYREVAAAILISTCGRLLLQRRDDIPGLLYGGMVGLFGGHREGSETNLDCLQREILEETGQVIAAERCEPLVQFSVRYPLGGGVKAEYFIVRDIPADVLVVTEGTLLAIEPSELPALLAEMTPSACYVARLFLELEKTTR